MQPRSQGLLLLPRGGDPGNELLLRVSASPTVSARDDVNLNSPSPASRQFCEGQILGCRGAGERGLSFSCSLPFSIAYKAMNVTQRITRRTNRTTSATSKLFLRFVPLYSIPSSWSGDASHLLKDSVIIPVNSRQS